MPLSKKAVRRFVTSQLGKEAIQMLLQYLERKKVSIWGERQPSDFLEMNLLLVLYKDLKNVGYPSLHAEIQQWYAPGSRTLRHNVKVLRRALKVWAKKRINKHARDRVNAHARVLPEKSNPLKINSLLDSVDYRLKGKSSTSRRHENWSYKLNAPGRRYMTVITLMGEVVQMWGGYSPKVFDGHFLEAQAQWFERHAKGLKIAADAHFSAGNRLFQDPKFFTPTVRRGMKRKRDDENNSAARSHLTKAQKKVNKQIRAIRARVEHPYAKIRNKWKTLDGVFWESEQQLDCLVWYATALHNYSIPEIQAE